MQLPEGRLFVQRKLMHPGLRIIEMQMLGAMRLDQALCRARQRKTQRRSGECRHAVLNRVLMHVLEKHRHLGNLKSVGDGCGRYIEKRRGFLETRATQSGVSQMQKHLLGIVGSAEEPTVEPSAQPFDKHTLEGDRDKDQAEDYL